MKILSPSEPPAQHTTRGDYTAGLRALADTLDKHDTLPVPFTVSLCIGVTDGADQVWVDLTRVAAALATPITTARGVHTVTTRFGPLTYRVAVCTEGAAAGHTVSDVHGAA